MGRRVNTAVWFDKYNRWQIKVQKDGERKTFYSSVPGRKGQRECNAKADAWLDDNIVSGDVRGQDMFNEWLEELKLTTGTGHWSNYKGYWNTWIKKSIGRMRVNDITEHHLQTVINRAYAAGRSKKHLKNIRACMTAFIKYCRMRKATTLIVENVDIPRGAPVGERTILQPNDIAILFTKDQVVYRGKEEKEPYINAFRFEVATGLRPGEVIGLKWSDIQGDQTVMLQRSINAKNETTTGKNDNARRTFALTPLSADILKDQRAWLLSTGVRSEYVFPHLDGDHIKQRTYYRHWIYYRNYNKIAEATPYELRHTFISMIKDLPEGLLKPLVGHSVDMDTYGTYSHEVTGDMERTASLVQEVFTKILTKKDTEDASSV